MVLEIGVDLYKYRYFLSVLWSEMQFMLSNYTHDYILYFYISVLSKLTENQFAWTQTTVGNKFFFIMIFILFVYVELFIC